MPLDAVTFDFWETLCTAAPDALVDQRRDVLLDEISALGVEVDRTLVVAVLDDAYPEWHRHWVDNRGHFGGPEAAEFVAVRLGQVEPGLAPHHDRLVAAFLHACDIAQLELIAGVAEVLGALADHGLRLGIICDVGMIGSPRLRGELERHGVLRRFSHWSFSDEVGVYKPDAAIFRHALAGLGGVEPARAAHIGDYRRTDMAGARAMGMRAVRFAGVHDDVDEAGGPEGDAVVWSYDDLPAALGLE